GDRDGKIMDQKTVPPFTAEEINRVLRQFEGEIWQSPPPYSAIHYKGRRLYEWAREGKRFEGPPRRIHIKQIELVEYQHPSLRVHMICSKGTYVRRLAEQLGEALGVPAHLEELRRLRVGILGIERAITLDQVSQEQVVN
ncbi:MAG: tRNA pseudouridine(55) synthase TruB, partial [Candidatus Omnitrophica bacterium]|nr:tRNA pseudouridine(55) synthase TruB [Candidatus Omnitrophota bacterium]